MLNGSAGVGSERRKTNNLNNIVDARVMVWYRFISGIMSDCFINPYKTLETAC